MPAIAARPLKPWVTGAGSYSPVRGREPTAALPSSNEHAPPLPPPPPVRAPHRRVIDVGVGGAGARRIVRRRQRDGQCGPRFLEHAVDDSDDAASGRVGFVATTDLAGGEDAV